MIETPPARTSAVTLPVSISLVTTAPPVSSVTSTSLTFFNLPPSAGT